MATIKVYVKLDEAFDFMEIVKKRQKLWLHGRPKPMYKHYTSVFREHAEIFLSLDEYAWALDNIAVSKDSEEFFQTDRFFPPEEE